MSDRAKILILGTKQPSDKRKMPDDTINSNRRQQVNLHNVSAHAFLQAFAAFTNPDKDDDDNTVYEDADEFDDDATTVLVNNTTQKQVKHDPSDIRNVLSSSSKRNNHTNAQSPPDEVTIKGVKYRRA